MSLDYDSTQDFGSAVCEPVSTRHLTLRFDGQGGEYFRIWIVNTVLTIVTLGLYWPWAKLRARRYFYGNTTLDGDAFAFLAKPFPLLWGYLLVAAAFVLYQAAAQFAPILSIFLALGFGLLWPWLYYKALRFRARYSAWRGVRFSFRGDADESYVINLFMPMLLPFTLGLIYPLIQKKRQAFVWNNLQLGDQPFEARLQGRQFYRVYLRGGLLLMLGGIAAGLLVAGVGAVIGAGFSAGAVWVPAAVYFVIIGLYAYVFTYVYVEVFNHTFESLRLGGIRFASSLETNRLFRIHMSNLLLTILTLGLYYPWAQIRRTRCILESVSIMAPEGALEAFFASEDDDDSALGDVASDVFDLEVGF